MNRLSIGLLLVCASLVNTAEPCVSGVPVGQKPGPYSFLVASGPQRGQPTCYVCETADNPGCIVFARKASDSLGKLLVQIDPLAARATNPVKSWATVLGEKTISIDDLGKWAKAQGLKNIPVGVFDDVDGPPSYKIANDAEVTVLIFNKRKVVHNYAFRTGELDEKSIKQIVEAASKMEVMK